MPGGTDTCFVSLSRAPGWKVFGNSILVTRDIPARLSEWHSLRTRPVFAPFLIGFSSRLLRFFTVFTVFRKTVGAMNHARRAMMHPHPSPLPGGAGVARSGNDAPKDSRRGAHKLPMPGSSVLVFPRFLFADGHSEIAARACRPGAGSRSNAEGRQPKGRAGATAKRISLLRGAADRRSFSTNAGREGSTAPGVQGGRHDFPIRHPSDAG